MFIFLCSLHYLHSKNHTASDCRRWMSRHSRFPTRMWRREADRTGHENGGGCYCKHYYLIRVVHVPVVVDDDDDAEWFHGKAGETETEDRHQPTCGNVTIATIPPSDASLFHTFRTNDSVPRLGQVLPMKFQRWLL